MKVKFKKLLSGARLPEKATKGAAAYDLYVAEDVIIRPGRSIVPLGFAMEMPEGVQALIDPRSGFSSKGMEGHRILENIIRFGEKLEHMDTGDFISLKPYRFNCDVIEGKIDSDYRGGVGVIVHNHDMSFFLKKGTRIAQMTFSKVESAQWEEVEELSGTDRDGGFGSTGTK